MIKHILFVVILLGGAYYFWTTRPIVHGPGEVAPNEPTQQRAYGINPISHNGVTIKPIARFDIEARVLSKKRYYQDDESEYAPFDIVVGWGPMSDENNLNEMMIKQADRSFYWEMIEPPIPIPEMREHTANLRLIHQDDKMLKKLEDIRVGHIIHIKGYLVNINTEEGQSVETSLIRNDIGKEATEIIWINELTIL